MMWSDFEKEYNLILTDMILPDLKGTSAFEQVLLVKCKNCSMTFLANAFQSHFKDCKKKNVAAVEKISIKKPCLKKKDKKKLDLDRHCGVLLENGEYCVRSLKCKNHTLNMKRQVVGRSNSFDLLYNDSSKTTSKIQSMPASLTNPDQEVAGILKSLEGYSPSPLVVYRDPCVLELAKRKNEFLLSDIVRAK